MDLEDKEHNSLNLNLLDDGILRLCYDFMPRTPFVLVTNARCPNETKKLKCALLQPLLLREEVGSRVHRPYFWNSQSRLSSGQTWRVLSHREMQWKWKA